MEPASGFACRRVARQVDPAAALAHHHANWSNPAEFTVVLTGDGLMSLSMGLDDA